MKIPSKVLFLSVISYTILKDLIESGNNDPATILQKLHSEFIKKLSVYESATKISDGLDIIIGIQDTENTTIRFASARMPPVFISEKTLTVIKPDIVSIGYSSLYREIKKTIEVRSMEHKYKRGDMLYVFSDGFADQFNYDNKKQILNKRFYSLLTEVSGLELNHQKNKLLKYFETWKGDNKQTDDVLLAGIRLN